MKRSVVAEVRWSSAGEALVPAESIDVGTLGAGRSVSGSLICSVTLEGSREIVIEASVTFVVVVSGKRIDRVVAVRPEGVRGTCGIREDGAIVDDQVRVAGFLERDARGLAQRDKGVVAASEDGARFTDSADGHGPRIDSGELEGKHQG